MQKLHQIVALVSGVKNRASAEIGGAHKINQKATLFEGLTRRYQPIDDDGEVFPNENKKVEKNVRDIISGVEKVMSELFDTILAQDIGNTQAKASVLIDNKPLLSDVPLTHLLFLEKQINDIETFFIAVPTLPDDVEWVYDANTDTYRSHEFVTTKGQKIEMPLVLYEATEKHPAQVQLITKDKTIGHWHQTRFSRAMPAKEKREILDRIRKLQKAITLAREEANTLELTRTDIDEGKTIFNYLLNK